MTVADAVVGSRPIHFHNEINKIAILNLENISTAAAARGVAINARRVYGRRATQRARCIRKGRPPLRRGSIWSRRGRDRSPNRLMGLQLSATIASELNYARFVRSANRPEGRNAAG